jgi:hypothetical protein
MKRPTHDDRLFPQRLRENKAWNPLNHFQNLFNFPKII